MRKHKWLVQRFELMNPSTEALSLSEILSAKVSFQGTYFFDAEIEITDEEAIPLQCVSGRILVQVPTLVANALDGELICHITLDGEDAGKHRTR